MSTSSTRSGGVHRRLNSIQNEGRNSRSLSASRRRILSPNDAYAYALRVAFLSHILQPRARRAQAGPPPPPKSHIRRSSSSFQDLMGDFRLVRDSKSTRFPHGFIAELEKRLTGVLMAREKRKEYKDPLVIRSFAVFLNALKEESFKKRMEKDRRVEDLVLIFFSNATKELSRGKDATDDSWSLMVDRHVALFVRLVSLILKDHDWAKDRPELTSRLAVLESKLLAHDQDLAETNGASKSTVETVAPLTYEVKDMPLVQFVARVFGVSTFQAQDDINRNKGNWTEQAALKDLKNYQAHLNLNTGKTLARDDFADEEAYEVWKRGEGPDLSQMMLAIMQANPQLAKSTPGGALPQFNALGQDSSIESSFPDLSRQISDKSNRISYVIDQPFDLSSLSFSDGTDLTESIYTFIPSDPRSFYRAILAHALMYDLKDQRLEATEATSEVPSMKLLSKQSTELLSEICLRWRIPASSRVVLFLDVIREKFVDQEIDINVVDQSFTFVKEAPMQEGKKRTSFVASVLFDRKRWIISDAELMRELLSALYEALLRELYDVMMHCYDPKPHPIGPVMYILEHHIRLDPHFVEDEGDDEKFRSYVYEGLLAKAKESYQRLLDSQIPAEQETWEVYHVAQLGEAILKLAQKIQKRYRNNPEIMRVNPLDVLLNCVLPMYAEDAQDMVSRLIQDARDKGMELPIEDGFDLYKGLGAIRRLYADTLPGQPFPFHIEGLLADFVWRWIRLTDEKIMEWVEQAARQDPCTVREDNPTNLPTDELRHSISVIDIFRSFNQVVEQLVNLEWDDDLQYAKFMTALSKSIGRGVARYCELLELSFAKEMDRLSPDQEAALVQTRQEKFMQLAKDAWNSKEKIEPFQFLPESLVKLNNIEYALSQLDKLEREINVDACADVIARYNPPLAQKIRKSTTYVFTIKIVEGEDLKACDINGLSDPYVVLTDEYQKRIAKSRIVYSNLNPRWDDSVDITTKGPLNIIATVWDWDAVGDHDYVGRTSLKLDPAHFGDFVPREFWLDLDTQGRILLRVSMEGERDDIQFYFGKAFRTLKRTEKEMTRKITEKLSAYISDCLSRRTLKALLNRGLTISSFLGRNRSQSTSVMPSQMEIENALGPLFTYFNDNFAIMDKSLTSEAMKMVMARLWKEVLVTIESLLVPPLSDKPSHQKPLTQQEVDIVSKWLGLLLQFFQVPDEVTGEANGVPLDILKSPKYHEIQSMNFFYFEPTENLIRTSERMASATAMRQQANKNRNSATAGPGHLGGSGLLGVPVRRAKSIMLVRNLGTMRKAKEEKRKEAQADPNDDMILRILRMRPEAAGYLRDRSRQKERLAAAAAADAIVKQSLMASTGGRMTSTLAMPGRR